MAAAIDSLMNHRRCLLLVYRLPWPPAAGGSLRDWQNISALAERTQLFVVALGGSIPAGPAHKRLALWTSLDTELLRKSSPFDGSEEVLENDWWRNELGYPSDCDWTPFRAGALRRLLKTTPLDFAVIEDVIFWRYAEIVRTYVPIVVDYHNVQSRVEESYLAYVGERGQPDEQRKAGVALRTMQYVEQLYRNLPAIVCSEAEKSALVERGYVPDAVAVVHNTVELTNAENADLPRRPRAVPRILFAGVMDYLPNVHAALELVGEILPRVRMAVPDVELWIVGMHPSTELLRCVRDVPGVYVTGQVAETASYFRSSSVLSVPLELGGGTRFKILEAFQYGLAVVSSPKGCEGLDVLDRQHLLVAHSFSAHAEAIVAVLQDAALAERLSSEGERLVRDRYSFATAVKQWDECLERFGLCE